MKYKLILVQLSDSSNIFLSYYTSICNQERIIKKEHDMNKEFKGVLSTIILVGILMFISFRFGPSDDSLAAKNTSHISTVKKIRDKDVVGVWINHHNKNLHQKITFHKNHKWNENQHGVKNIYSGTWKIVGKRTINLAPYGEKIVFDKHDVKKIDVVNYHHILNKK